MSISQDQKQIVISQRKYLRDVLKRFGEHMDERLNPVTPLPAGTVFRRNDNDSEDLQDTAQLTYRELIGKGISARDWTADEETYNFLEDNEAAKFLAENSAVIDRSKHIRLMELFEAAHPGRNLATAHSRYRNQRSRWFDKTCGSIGAAHNDQNYWSDSSATMRSE